jgi:hypothetical protein
MDDITIIQGDADTITDEISNLSSLGGYSCKMYIYTPDGVEYDTVVGSIIGLVCTYQFVNETTKAYLIGRYRFETKIWDAADHVYTPSRAGFFVKATGENDPS